MTITASSSVGALAGVLLLACSAGGAWAAAATTERSTTKVAEATQAHAEAAVDDEAATCNKARKRLWIEGEGWIVRRVTTCR